jgi:hypothetical protein
MYLKFSFLRRPRKVAFIDIRAQINALYPLNSLMNFGNFYGIFKGLIGTLSCGFNFYLICFKRMGRIPLYNPIFSDLYFIDSPIQDNVIPTGLNPKLIFLICLFNF